PRRERVVAGRWGWCQAGGMSFFDSIPQPPAPPEPVRRRRPVWMRSDVVIPGSVRAEVVLARTGQVAVAIGSVRAYPNGFEFTLHTRQIGRASCRERVEVWGVAASLEKKKWMNSTLMT